mmetsp:Transcript_39214/g.77093  ORF Transcript_39214/g.77093 Transcript_39214/m.77093 type:complete len:277 (+) Transcript_39214:29-859(+)
MLRHSGPSTEREPLVNYYDSAISDQVLKKYNIGACVLHATQGLLMLIASQAVTSIKDFKKTITRSYLVYNETTRGLDPGYSTVGTVEIGVVAAAFLLLSALAHLWVLVFWGTYINDLKKEVNRARWYEYSLSSSLMIMGIAILFGVYDVGSLILIFFINACMNLFGLLMEQMNPPDRKQVNWTPFLFGCVAGVAPWIVVFIYFFGGNIAKVPKFVNGILASYFIFFNTFPVNMFLQYAKKGKWVDYRHGEKVYIVLSLFSKSMLAWLVFGGTFQPN